MSGTSFEPARFWRDPRQTRLLDLDPCAGRWHHAAIDRLASRLGPGDLLIVNDAATLPASLTGSSCRGPVEIRLAAMLADDRWRALAFGGGDWHVPTELRPTAPLAVGDRLELAGLGATIAHVDGERLVTLVFDRRGAALWRALYAAGRPIQYSYLAAELPLWALQNVYASRPWAVESPSAGRGLTWELLGVLRRRGVGLARLTHAAGLSSTGDPGLDATLPWPERFTTPAATFAAIGTARRRGGRVIAVGTSVVRALEGVGRDDPDAFARAVDHVGTTDLVLGPDDRLAVVDGLLTGLHEPSASHFQLLQAFARGEVIEAAYRDAVARGYLGHELGDANLILCASGA